MIMEITSVEFIPLQTRLEYIESLELAIHFDENLIDPCTEALSFSTTTSSAKVVGGSAVSFLPGVPAAQQQDVLNSTLLAQLAANKKYDREKQTVQWYQYYQQVLGNLGWVIQSFSFNSFNTGNLSFTVDKAILGILMAALSGNELAVLTSTIKALGNLSAKNKRAIQIFENSGSQGAGGNFQMSQATLDGNQNVSMSIGANHFKSNKHVTNFLFFKFKSKDIDLYAGNQRAILNDQIYSTVRSAVIAKLGANAQKFVGDLDI
ncbi:MAG: hypothetical protein AAF570_07955 [Bacteroidota bacterium]